MPKLPKQPEIYSVYEKIMFSNFGSNISNLRIFFPQKVTSVFVAARFALHIFLSQT